MDSSSGINVILNTTEEDLATGNRMINDNEDIISNLPDAILGHILSFVPIKEAVRASVLSSKWIHLWKLITSIHLNEGVLFPQLRNGYFSSQKRTENVQFAHIVNRVLNHHANSSIENFSFFVSDASKYDPSKVNAWISDIIRRRVQKLQICYTESFCSSFPIFSCSSLSELELAMNCKLMVPMSICLPNLQFLTLDGIAFMHDSGGAITFSFPVLKVLTALRSAWLGVENVCIKAPQLESFLMTWPVWNVIGPYSCAVMISATHLKYFCVEVDQLHDFILSDSSSLDNCSASFYAFEQGVFVNQEKGLQTCMLLKQLQEVHCLKLYHGAAKILSSDKDWIAKLPLYGRLTYLQLQKVAVETLLNLLHKSPILETLVLNIEILPFDEGLLTSAPVPRCLLSSLKVVKIEEFKGDKHEASLAKYFIDNSAVLDCLSIITDVRVTDSDMKMDKVKKWLLSCPRISGLAQVEFMSYLAYQKR